VTGAPGTLLALVALGALVLAACEPSGPDRPHIVLGRDAAALREAFNADSGAVRVVMLLSPT
jgi:hypothetical protein